MKPLLIIACVACLLYANTLTNDLVFDDAYVVTGQKAIRHPWNLREIFGGRYYGELREQDPLYRPLTIWALALNDGLNRAFGLPGEHPVGFHLTNVFLHALVGCALYWFLTGAGISTGASLTASLLFAAHPIHTEAVASVVNRSELLAALFGLAFLTLHRRRNWMAVGCYLLAMWSKESAAAFLAVAVWTDVCFPGKRSTWPLARYAGYAAALTTWVGLRAMAVGDRSLPIPRPDNPLVDVSLLERVWTAGRVQFDYLRLQAWPVGLSSDYSLNQVPVVSGWFDAGALVFLGIVIAGAVASWRLWGRHPVVVFSTAGYAILFSPTSNFLFPIGTIMGERLAYAPSIFFCLLAGYGLWALCRGKRRVAVGAVGAVLVFYSGLTVSRNRTWANDSVFCQTQVRSAPNSAKAHYGAARQYLVAGDLDRGIGHLRQCLEISPERPAVWNTLGTAYIQKGDPHAAARVFQEALRIYKNRPGIYYNLGRAYQLMGAYAPATEAFLSAIRLDRTFVEAYINLGGVYFQTDRLSDARAAWRRGLNLDPGSQVLQDNLKALEDMGREGNTKSQR